MALDLTKPDPAPVLEMLAAFRRSKVMFAAVSLGVFDALEVGPQSLELLASKLRCNSDSLTRLLNTCVGLGLLRHTAEGYANAPIAQTYLTTSSPDRLTGYLNFSNDVIWDLFAHLEDAIREGTHRWQQAYGWDGPIFESLFKTADQRDEFLMGMHGFGMISSPAVVSAFDLSRFKRLVDLGGATGHLVVAACRRYPELAGVVYDLPHALGLARQFVAEAELNQRIEIIGGDFFSDPLPPADLYALGRIIHDWTTEKSVRLLTRIQEVLPHGGAVLLAEKILWEDKSGPPWAQLQDLNMLCCTEGRERTLAEYETLLKGCGFSQVTGSRTTTPLDAILAVK